ncbi:MAG TPA: PAS domain-containing protein, partial [Bacteroidota bacterium]|nr:PAS domain-containing protein [Bacteroidota bacterium]
MKSKPEWENREEILLENVGKLSEALKLANAGYWEHDLIADRITWSEETCVIFGAHPNPPVISQAELEAIIHPEDRALRRQALADAFKGHKQYDMEYRIIRPDGIVRFIHVRDGIEYDKSGKPIRMFGVIQDITDLKKAEFEIRMSENRFAAAFKISPVGILISRKSDGSFVDV